MAAGSHALIELVDARRVTTGWLRTADGVSWEPASVLDGLTSKADVQRIVIDSNGSQFLAAVYDRNGGWTMAMSSDGAAWHAVAGKTDYPRSLTPMIMPRGVYLVIQLSCSETASGGVCASAPQDGRYGPAR